MRHPDNLPCLSRAWASHAGELRRWLRGQLEAPQDAEDLLQELFVKGLRQGKGFCAVENTRAWLFRLARNAVIDRRRLRRDHLPLPEELPALPGDEPAPVDQLTQCLPRVLAELPEADRLAIQCCEIEGRTQQELAEQLGLSVSGAKSRLQRARRRLRQQLEQRCQVRYDEHGKVSGFTPQAAVAPA